MSALHSTRWARTRRLILRRDGFRCYWCGGRATEADHIKARIEGGAMYDPANLVAACKPCNGRRGAEVAAARNKRSFRGEATTQPRMSKSRAHNSGAVWYGAIRA